MSVPKWYQNAIEDLGLTEGKGSADNPAVVEMYKYTGYNHGGHDSVPWCGAAIAKWMSKAGIKYTKSQAAAAIYWSTWGKPLKEPIVGAVGVKKRPGGNHVFLFAGYVDGTNKTKFKMLGGNQSGGKASGHDGAVTLSVGRMSDIFAWRWPEEVALPVEDQKLRKSGVMQGATVVAGTGTAIVAEQVVSMTQDAAITGPLSTARDQLSTGSWIGIGIGVVILAAALFIIWSRIRGAQRERELAGE